MLTERRIALATTLIAIGILWFAAVFPGVLPSYIPDECKPTNEPGYQPCTYLYIFLSPTFRVWRFFADRHLLEPFFIALTAVFTGTLWWTTRLLWRTTGELVAGAEGTAMRQLRAYLFVESIDVADGGDLAREAGFEAAEIKERTGTPGVIILGKNSGQTPAYRMIHWGNIDVIAPSDEDKLVLPQITAGTVPENPVSPSGTFRKHLWFRVMSEDEIAKVRTGALAIFVYGIVWYLDAFGRAQWTTYRLFYSGRYPPLRGATFTFSQRGNDVSNP